MITTHLKGSPQASVALSIRKLAKHAVKSISAPPTNDLVSVRIANGGEPEVDVKIVGIYISESTKELELAAIADARLDLSGKGMFRERFSFSACPPIRN